MALASDKIAVMKAEVSVKMLEVLVKGGVGPEKLLEVVQGMSENLIAGPTALAIEAKSS
jgi:hypothetical protein